MPSEIPLGYRMLRRFAHFWIRRFFRKVVMIGQENVCDGPVLFAMNHPNNFIDTLMVSYAIERKIHYLATSRMFQNKLLALFLDNAGVIPVYRKQDDPIYAEKNVATFQACYEVLRERGAIGIYPEGTTHTEPRVKKIKTGAARIALETVRRYHNALKIIPVGLNFSVRKSFREEVTVRIGTAIDVTAYLPQYETDPVAAVERLTAHLQDALEEQVLHIETPALEELVRDIEEIYKGELIHDLIKVQRIDPDEIDAFRLSKKLVEVIDFYNRRDPTRLRRAQEQIQNYKNRLKKVHLQDGILRKIQEDRNSYRSFLLHVTFLTIGLPIALWGSINHFLPYQLSRWFSQKMAKRETDYATIRILAGVILYPIFYTVQIYWTILHFGWLVALVYGSSLPMFGAFAYYYWEKIKNFGDDLQLFFVKITRKRLLNRLKERREQLIAEIDQARDDYLKAGTQT